MADRIGVMQEGKLEQIVEVKLHRPRAEENAAFTKMVHALKEFLEEKNV